MYCKFCGKQIPSDSRFCNYCGGEQNDGAVDSISAGEEGEFEVTPPPSENLRQPPPPPTEPRRVKSQRPSPEQTERSQVVMSSRQKTVAFWSRHPIFSNLVAFVCAATVLFVALFSPIKMPWYDVYGGGTPEDKFTVVRSEQTLFMFIESLPYYMGAEYDETELDKERDEAVIAAQKEYYEWLERHESASDDEKLQKRYDLIAEHLSDLNCFKYMAVTAKTTEEESAKAMIWISLLFGIVIVILTAITAVNSLITAIRAIVGMCKRRMNVGLFPYLQKVFALSTAGVTLTMCAPLLCVGGGMLAVALISAIAYFICAVVKAAVADGRAANDIIKRSVVALVAAVMFILLCVDPMAVTNVDKTETVVVPIGFGLYSRMAIMLLDDASTQMPNNMGLLFVQYVAVACVAVPLVAKALLRALRRICDTEYGKPFRDFVVAAVALSIAIIIGLLSKPIYDLLYEHFGEEHCFDMLSKMRPQVWVCAALSVAAAVFDKIAFRRSY